MRFRFALSAADRKRLRTTKLEAWHRRFAWLPVEVGYAEWIWLEWVEARRLCSQNYLTGDYVWEYRIASFKGLLP